MPQDQQSTRLGRANPAALQWLSGGSAVAQTIPEGCRHLGRRRRRCWGRRSRRRPTRCRKYSARSVAKNADPEWAAGLHRACRGLEIRG